MRRIRFTASKTKVIFGSERRIEIRKNNAKLPPLTILAWRIEIDDAAKKELAKLDKPVAKRMVDFLRNHLAVLIAKRHQYATCVQ